ncbi:MAG: CPXCG motif-containing cysteine-rich protein [Planctomycetaceae bacterium]
MMKQLKVEESFLDDYQELSLFDVISPLFKMDEHGVPEQLLGSCFAIGVGIYATAAHIFDPFTEARRLYKPLDPRDGPPPLEDKLNRQADMKANRLFEGVDVNCGALVFEHSGIREGKLSPKGFSLVRHVVIFLDEDIALLFLHEDERGSTTNDQRPIAILPLIEHPQVGEVLTVAGYPGSNNRIQFDVIEQKIEGAAWIGLVASEGEITRLNEFKRDEGQCFYPCIETTASMKPGHSGGPAISKDSWGVVGVNSSSLGNHGYSVVSWIGKAIDLDFELPFEIKLGTKAISSGSPISLRRMAECNVIRIIRSSKKTLRILFLNGWHSRAGGVTLSCLKKAGNEVIILSLNYDGSELALLTAQAEYNQNQPDLIVGSCRGGAVAMMLNSGDTPIVLLCPDWKQWGINTTLKPNSMILHCPDDNVVPFTDSEELVAQSGLSPETLIAVGKDHSLTDDESLAVLVWACEVLVSGEGVPTLHDGESINGSHSSQNEGSYTCDSCGELIIIPLDLSEGVYQTYVEDCPVCCHPNTIHVLLSDDGSARVWAEPEQDYD